MAEQTNRFEADKASAWNAAHPEGTYVRYWTGAREGAGQTGRTRSTARVLGGHTAVVWVTGHGACIALTHVQPEPESTLHRLVGTDTIQARRLTAETEADR
jgi:hypothetical protein